MEGLDQEAARCLWNEGVPLSGSLGGRERENIGLTAVRKGGGESPA